MTFWTSPGATPATDWPPGANGAYGYSQDVCGRYMAERVGRIWDNNGGIPSPKDLTIPGSERSEKTWTSFPRRAALDRADRAQASKVADAH